MEIPLSAKTADGRPDAQASGKPTSSIWAAIRNNLICYGCLAPVLTLFFIYRVLPFFWAIGLSVMEGDVVSQNKLYVGLKNYGTLATDRVTLKVFSNSVKYVLTSVPLGVIVALLIAFLIGNSLVRRPGLYRGVVYFPILASGAAVAQIWSYILAPRYGVLSYLLSAFGLSRLALLSNPRTALYTLVMINLWRGIGFNVVLFMASMLGIPDEIKEAAVIDGANGRQVAMRIIIPLMRPVILFAVVMGTIGAFQMFDLVYVMTSGGPAYSTATMVWYIYNYAFRYGNIGMAAAMGVVLLLVIAPISFIQMRVLGRTFEY